MYPFFTIFGGNRIYVFGIFLLISFLIFSYMLRKLRYRYNFDLNIFTSNILWYFISMFVFSRFFYVIGSWNDLKFIESSSQFFITTDYDFSLFGAIFGFALIFFINIRLRKERLIKYIDSIVLSFLISLSVGCLGALFGGQIYGITTNIGIEIIYNNPFSPISSTPVFPLALVYFILFFIEFAFLYILSLYIKVKGFIGYIGFIIFGLTVLIFENFSGKQDIFDLFIFLNLNQILSIFLMIFSSYRLYILSQISAKDTTVIINE